MTIISKGNCYFAIISFSTENNLLTGFQKKTTVNYAMHNLRWFINLYTPMYQTPKECFIAASKMWRLLSVKKGIPHTLKLVL